MLGSSFWFSCCSWRCWSVDIGKVPDVDDCASGGTCCPGVIRGAVTVSNWAG